jgi:hypothetical protein
MPMGTAFTTPLGTFRCDSSSRGITCADRASGASFTIGDHRTIVRRAGSSAGQPPYPDGAAVERFASVDRLQRCSISETYVICNSGPSGQGVSLSEGGEARYEGVTGSADRGGPALRFGQTVSNPSGSIVCDSSSRGITCVTSNGNRFVIGDHYVRVRNNGYERRYER